MYLPVLLFVSVAFASLDLLDNGQIGAILGSSFGIPGDNATFDYVIVGGGTAGLTIATRLAEDPSLSVAVVEAGGFYEIDNGNLSIIPASAPRFSSTDPKDFQPLIDWGFNTVPQVNANFRTIHYPRGKTLGGSSARNYMFYHRGNKGAYQKWADEVDDQTYTFDNLLPFFKKSCNYTGPNQALYTNSSNSDDGDAFSSTGGPLHVSSGNFVDSFGTWAQRAFKAIGLKQIDGFNSGTLLGSAFGTSTINPSNAHRSSSESSFLQTSLRNGSSLRVYKNTLAQRILFDVKNGATGVAVTTAGTYGVPSLNYTLNARKEVIVSAGAFQSPQLLMVSGVGPRDILKKFNIPCVHGLAGVGQNMWDHVLFGVGNRVNVQTISTLINSPAAAANAAELFRNNATGPLSIFGSGYYGWEKLPEPYRSGLSNETRAALNDTFPPDWPEVEWLSSNAFITAPDPRDGFNYATITTALVAPLSRGTVSIQSAEMTTPPVIDPNYFSAPADVELAIQLLHRQREAWAVLTNAGLTIGDEVLPGPNVTSDADVLNFIKSSFIEVYHAAATCKMGRRDDPMAVVDSAGRVFGTQSLRVVDASSFPFLPPGHPQANVYMLAEKIADSILRQA
ncbi:hypothetical protein MMC07_007071 [Pseudocyphellaria aurata]|nr:hypothetical protein [Pseudocyphellaria aurata]